MRGRDAVADVALLHGVGARAGLRVRGCGGEKKNTASGTAQGAEGAGGRTVGKEGEGEEGCGGVAGKHDGQGVAEGAWAQGEVGNGARVVVGGGEQQQPLSQQPPPPSAIPALAPLRIRSALHPTRCRKYSSHPNIGNAEFICHNRRSEYREKSVHERCILIRGRIGHLHLRARTGAYSSSPIRDCPLDLITLSS